MAAAQAGAGMRKILLDNQWNDVYLPALDAAIQLPGHLARGIVHGLGCPAQKKHVDRDLTAWSNEFQPFRNSGSLGRWVTNFRNGGISIDRKAEWRA